MASQTEIRFVANFFALKWPLSQIPAKNVLAKTPPAFLAAFQS
jgi:hypothetical protein